MPDRPSANELKQLLVSILTLEPPDAETRMGLTVGEGLVLPSAEEIHQRALPTRNMADLLDETMEWTHTVVRSEWLADDLAQRFFAVPQGVGGEDAFIAAWACRDRPFQLVVTRERLHLVTRLPEAHKAATDDQKAELALSTAHTLLQVAEPSDAQTWEVRPFGGLTLGYRDVAFAKDWHETLLFLTDGFGVKYSVMKYRNRTSPMERSSAQRTAQPWFPSGSTK